MSVCQIPDERQKSRCSEDKGYREECRVEYWQLYICNKTRVKCPAGEDVRSERGASVSRSSRQQTGTLNLMKRLAEVVEASD